MADQKVVQVVGVDGTSGGGIGRWAQQDELKQGQEVGLQRQGGQVSHLSQVLRCWMGTNGIHSSLDVTCCAVRPQPWVASKAQPSRPCSRSSLVPFPLSYFRRAAPGPGTWTWAGPLRRDAVDLCLVHTVGHTRRGRGLYLVGAAMMLPSCRLSARWDYGMRLLSSVLLMLMLVPLLRACAAVQRPIRVESSRVQYAPRPSINSNPLADMSSLFFVLPPELLQSA